MPRELPGLYLPEGAFCEPLSPCQGEAGDWGWKGYIASCRRLCKLS